MRNDKRKAVHITIISRVDGETIRQELDGEYAAEDGIRYVSYTDHTGNVSTGNKLAISDNQLLLRRSGGVSGDMLFKPDQTTSLSYSVSCLNVDFRLETEKYRLTETKAGMDIYLKYRLHSGPSTDEHIIVGEQGIKIRFLR